MKEKCCNPDTVDYEKEFEEKIKKESGKFRHLRTVTDKFREIYDWINGLIQLCDELAERIKIIEKDIQEIREEMNSDQSK